MGTPDKFLERTISIVERLQRLSIDSYQVVLSQLKVGMSEVDIASLIAREFNNRGIVEFWYNVPHMVLIGVERFRIGTTTADYTVKSPSRDALLKPGSPVHIDLSPIDPTTKQWGDWSSTVVFHPRPGIDDEQVAFLEEMRQLLRYEINQITAQTTGAEIANYFLKIFKAKGITLLDVRNNVGHSLCSGPKNQAQRIWLDENNSHSLGEGIYAIEPGGICTKADGGGFVVGRFEEVIYIPKQGNAIILGNKKLVPLIV